MRQRRASADYPWIRIPPRALPLTLSLSPGGGEGIEMAPSLSERERVGVRVRMCSRLIRGSLENLSMATPIATDLDWKRQIIGLDAPDLSVCYQCGTCTAVCPVSTAENPFPRK